MTSLNKIAPDLSPKAEIIEMLAIADIDHSERLRPSDPDWVQGIAASYAVDGQLQAIEVCRLVNQKSGKPYKLGFGGHRIDAAILAGWTHIACVVRSANALERRSREVAENFFRAKLSPLDEARFVQELIKTEKLRLGILDDQDGRVANARDGKNAKKKQLDDDLCIVHKSYGLQEIIAGRLGLHRSSVSRHLSVAGLPASLTERVRKLPIGTNAAALRALAKMEPSDQIRAVTLMEGGAKDINAAQAMMRGAPVIDAAKKRLKTFQDTFNRMGRAEQMEALRVLSNVLPKGVDLYFYKNLDERFAKESALIASDKPAAVAAPVTDRPTNVVDLEDIIRGAAE
ncbi:Nucleoid occlusion protein [Asticcacaulis sp. MM231]|uniref:ParB/RepB/Spo0J family partition protein n=1 Tax=Asticcacaulis sp. MM231 TaxID=3157666 RepID=UPI0032D59D67